MGDVDDMTAHRGSGDKASVGEVLKLVARQIGTLLLLSSPVSSSGASAIPCGIEIGLDNIEVVLDRAINSRALGPGNTGVSDENIEAAVEVLDGLIDGGLGLLLVPQIGLICLG